MVLETDLAWLACAIDSEGSITAIYASRRGSTQTVIIPKVIVANTHLGYIQKAQWLLEEVGGKPVKIYSSGGTNRPILKVSATSQAAVKKVLIAVLPWLVIKRHRAETLVEWINARSIARQRRPNRGGGTPYGEETELLISTFKGDD